MTVPMCATAPQHNLTLGWISAATAGFAYADQMREAVSLALAAGRNFIFFGPGGHAKSEFLNAAFSVIRDVEPFVKCIGQGTTPEELFGGIDLDAFNRPDGAVLQFNARDSFLDHLLVVLEEMLDGPARSLTSLKDTLTAKELRNGNQRHPMRTKVIAVPTNRSPQEVASLGPDVAALMERFPIQIEVKWDSYSAASYIHMYQTVAAAASVTPQTVTWSDIEQLQSQTDAVEISETVVRVFANVVSDLRSDQVFLSPRTFMMGIQLIKAAAAINGRSQATMSDVRAMQYLPGCQAAAERIDDLLEEMTERFQAEENLETLEGLLRGLEVKFQASNEDLDALLSLDNECSALRNEANTLAVSAELGARRFQLIQSCSAMCSDVLRRYTELEALQATLATSVVIDAHVQTVRTWRAKLAKLTTVHELSDCLDELKQFEEEVASMNVAEMYESRVSAVQRDIRSLVNNYQLKISKLRTRTGNGWRREGANA